MRREIPTGHETGSSSPSFHGAETYGSHIGGFCLFIPRAHLQTQQERYEPEGKVDLYRKHGLSEPNTADVVCIFSVIGSLVFNGDP